LRANNILKIALTSLDQHAKFNEINRKLKKVAAFVFLEKNLRKVFKILRTPLLHK
jgi:hypothetical protein